MKKFREGGECFALSSFRIDAAPIAEDDMVSIELARTICEDACFLSSEGTGQTSIEILRLAGNHAGSRITHLLTVRTHDPSEQGCMTRQEALANGILTALRQAGFAVHEIPYGLYHDQLTAAKKDAIWAVRKKSVQEYGVHETYWFPPSVVDVDWKMIYTSLDGSGCSLCVQIIPSMLSDSERNLIASNSARYAQAMTGVVPNMRDELASSPAERWKTLSGEMSRPFAEVNLLVCGDATNAALVTARIRRSIRESSLQSVALPDFGAYRIYNLPWMVMLALKKTAPLPFSKWTSEEVSRIFQMPSKRDYFIGMEENAFSLLPESELLPHQLTDHTGKGMPLGTTVYSRQKLYLPLDQFLLHTAVLGKSGTGKTTLLKRFIRQFNKMGIPVLIMEPIKREFRDTVISLNKSRIFTVERPIVPLLINPFYVPEGVALGEYKNSLLSAFKAAFSLPDPLPALFEKAISEAYTLHGWTDRSMNTDKDVEVFDMTDFVRVFKRLIANSTYSEEVKGNMMSGGAFRLQSLIERCPRTFGTVRSTSVSDLLAGCTLLEMGNLDPEQKSLVSALTLITVLSYLKATRQSDGRLRNIIMIDEAHALLDQGEGTTQEEKTLNSTMAQLMINVITEIRAYGVGVVFSDQSPTRVGGCLLDNVDNIISFRLSGEEAEKLKEHAGADNRLARVLPLMDKGDYILKNRYLAAPLPSRMNYNHEDYDPPHATDAQIAHTQQLYLSHHSVDYKPFSLCDAAGCRHCVFNIRDDSNKYASQFFAERRAKIKTPEDVASHILRIPHVLSVRSPDADPTLFHRTCGCIALHLLRRCSLENGISLSPASTQKILAEMFRQKQTDKGDNNDCS